MSKYKIIWDKFGLPVVLGILVILLIAVIIITINATSIGTNAGKQLASTAGAFWGTIEGVTNAPEAYSDGKQEGLSAKDTRVEILEDIISSEGNKLEVLVAGISLTDMHNVSDKYHALYILSADVVFTIDMNEVSESVSEDGKITIELPNPEFKSVPNENKTEKLAERTNKFFNGSTKDGYDAYINSLKVIDKESVEALENHEELMSMAKDSAESQIKSLVIASNINVNESDIEISFKE